MARTKATLHKVENRPSPWSVRWFGDYDVVADRQRRYSHSFRLKSEAQQFRAMKQVELDRGAKRDRPEKITLGKFCKLYMERRGHEWRAKTYIQLDNLCNRLTNHFGDEILLSSISTEKATRFWGQARNTQKHCEGNEISRYTKNRILRDAKTMFSYAVKWEYLAKNPFEGMKRLRIGKRQKNDWRYITPDEYHRLQKVAPDQRWKVFYALAYTTGGRYGELFNLTEDCIDLNKQKILFKDRIGTKDLPPFEIKDYEDREVPLPNHVVKMLKTWFNSRANESPLFLLTPDRFHTVMERWRNCRTQGKPWLNNYLTNNVIRDIRRQAKTAGLIGHENLTVHCFRKSCGQNWANHLPMNVVKELMGHADISTTAKFYSIVTEEHEAKARWVMEALISNEPKIAGDVKLTSKANFKPNQRSLPMLETG